MDSFPTSSPSAQAADGASAAAMDAATAPTAAAATPAAAGRRSEHPLIWLALLVWLSVEVIGEGLVALGTLLADVTPTATASAAAAATAQSDQLATGTLEASTATTAEALPTPQVTPS